MHNVVHQLRKLIHRHRFRHQINQRVAAIFGHDSEKCRVLMDAIDLVTETHNNGKRDNGEFLKSHEYAMFVIALVHCNIRDMAILLAIIFHDMHEDHPEKWPLEQIANLFGQDVARLVRAVTKPRRWLFESDEDYEVSTFRRVRDGGYKAIIIKCIDRLHNMLTLVGTEKKKVAKILQTIRYVLPMSVEEQFLVFELMAATTEQSANLNVQPKHKIL